jgi:predicted nucleotidyltransferase
MSKVVFRTLDYDAVLARLRRVVGDELAPRAEVREVILVGSLARGDWSARSDADLVVIVDAAEEPVAPFRAPDYRPRGDAGVPIDVFVYTPEEAQEWGPRYRSDVEHGLILYRRP